MSDLSSQRPAAHNLTSHRVFSLSGRLEKAEIPARVALTATAWSPDNNLVTAAYKLKRKELSNFYRDDLQRIYQ